MNALELITATVEPDSRDPRNAWVRTISRGLASLGPVVLEPRRDKYVVGHELRVGDLHLILNLDDRGEINTVVRYRNAWLCRLRVKNHADARGYAASVVDLVHAIRRCSTAQELYDYSTEHRGYREMLNGLSASHVKLLLPGKILDASGFPVTATVEPKTMDLPAVVKILQHHGLLPAPRYPA